VIANRIVEDLAPTLAVRGMTNPAILLRNIELPPVGSDAIQQKLKAEQEAEQMRFVLDRERQEAERKRIEAQGIADFQRIISTGIDDRLLGAELEVDATFGRRPVLPEAHVIDAPLVLRHLPPWMMGIVSRCPHQELRNLGGLVAERAGE
jgi:regulator of protease activity HflC (stomatin/prohibitin superfamily)